MPTAPYRPCPQCRQVGCTAHNRHKRYDAQRSHAAGRGYDYQWQQVSKAYRIANPLCAHCAKAGRVALATEVDHIVPLVDGGERLDWSNLQSLCHQCHVRKTNADQRNLVLA